MDNFPDSGIADANTADSSLADSSADAPALDTGNDAMIDACMPSAEICNGVSDDCDALVDEGSCDFPNTSATCEPGGCVISACDEGFLDCSEGMGCETASDRNNCGACGTVCGATEGCEAGVCVEHTLDWWWTVEPRSRLLLATGAEQNYMLTAATTATRSLRSSTQSPLTLTGAARSRAYLFGLDESGTRLWEVAMSAETLEATSISVIEGVDAVFIAGSFAGTLRAGAQESDVELTSTGVSRDAFVFRVDASGSVQTVAHLTDHGDGDTHQSITDITVGPGGTVFAVGSSGGPFSDADGRPTVTEVESRESRFIARLGSGSRDRAIMMNSGSPIDSIAADDGSVYVALRNVDEITIGGESYVTAAEFMPLIASFDHDLEVSWVQTPVSDTSGDGEDYPIRMVTRAGQIFMGHWITRAHTFGGQLIDEGAYVAALSASDGSVTWVRAIPLSGEAGDDGNGVASAGGRLYFAGNGFGNVDLGGGSLGPAVAGDAVFGVLQSSGEYDGARRFGGLGVDAAREVQPTGSGVMVSGSWSDAMTVDGVTFEASDSSAAFVFHFSSDE